MKDGLYFLAVVNTYTSTNYRNHDTHNFCKHFTAYTPFRVVSWQTQPLENITANTSLQTHHGTHRIYGHIRVKATFTDRSRNTQPLQTHHGSRNFYRDITAHTNFTDT